MKPFATAAGTWRRLFAAALVLVLSLFGSACGPGVGGTGTGETASLGAPLDAFGAAPAAVCASDIASQLACPVPGSAAGPGTAQAAGTAPVFFADAARASSLRIDGNRAELEAPCAGLRFGGEWGAPAGQPPRFYGATDDGLATLVVVAVSGGLSVQVFDAQGRSLFGPRFVERLAAPVALGCS